ncbi:hypothetical protein C0966_00870 [Bacillus methanolicus]|uniref:hypothetical protein n=1 Tax=Bacillus methanolicus TaxID=1471 RepID=UPI002380C205|nr:hypothetical protein [Bacillus methanolicus]MDE3837959.1 hypothetical protein [Bacillus methanolicus]
MKKRILKEVMKRAWKLARNGQRKFGGKVSEYLAHAMKIAWAWAKRNIDHLSGKEAREINFVRRGNVSEKQADYIVVLLQKIGDRVFDADWVKYIEECADKVRASAIIRELKMMAYAPKF